MPSPEDIQAFVMASGSTNASNRAIVTQSAITTSPSVQGVFSSQFLQPAFGSCVKAERLVSLDKVASNRVQIQGQRQRPQSSMTQQHQVQSQFASFQQRLCTQSNYQDSSVLHNSDNQSPPSNLHEITDYVLPQSAAANADNLCSLSFTSNIDSDASLNGGSLLDDNKADNTTSQSFYSEFPDRRGLYPYSPLASTSSLQSPHTHSLSLDSTVVSSSVSSIQSPVSDDYRRKRPRKINSSASIIDPTERQLVDTARRESGKDLNELSASITLTEQLISSKIKERASPLFGKAPTGKEIKLLESQKKHQRQVFAMVVLLRSVLPKEAAICPRNRIYNKYVNICRQYGLIPICNASFGKLVKLSFPNIKTRRLGIRGSSRYHYCGLKLIDDSESLDYVTPPSARSTPSDYHSTPLGIYQTPGSSKFSEDSGANGSFSVCFEEHLFRYFNDKVPQFQPSVDKYLMLCGDLEDKAFQEFAQVYTSFTLRVFQNLRYMKVKTLFDELANFNLQDGTLSPEALNCLQIKQEHVSYFVSRCDSDLYSCCIKLLSKTVFQNVPEAVRAQISNLDTRLLSALDKMSAPEYIKKAKREPLKRFVTLVSQLCKVISSAANLADAMIQPETRNTLLQDYSMLDIETIVNEDLVLPEEFKNRAIFLLENDCMEMFQKLSALSNGEDKPIGSIIIQTISSYLLRFPSNFRTMSPTDFLLCISSLVGSLLRQLTHQGTLTNFDVWWKANCWVSEFFNLIGGLGAFLKKNSMK
ncbi:hypothetical protein FOA43_002842 [Brettanomyces nanus]|uniref:RFX-type winged-helix domain-containing protein n=1 Tax=Eeniella nana TaxID=13502 RepID=A0A875RVF2_EENNA|nr:uncharacterized protein FOA43_002842 [Brettanomyces nanus]QPG75487.1 hypothetical protein FOA43_002842 [Brettanomyces nanus]